MRERVLKLSFACAMSLKVLKSLPIRERVLKLATKSDIFASALSLPIRERVLKPPTETEQPDNGKSLPIRERVLKHHCRHH